MLSHQYNQVRSLICGLLKKSNIFHPLKEFKQTTLHFELKKIVGKNVLPYTDNRKQWEKDLQVEFSEEKWQLIKWFNISFSRNVSIQGRTLVASNT